MQVTLETAGKKLLCEISRYEFFLTTFTHYKHRTLGNIIIAIKTERIVVNGKLKVMFNLTPS